MADPTEAAARPAARPAVDPSTERIRCPLLMIAASAEAAPSGSIGSPVGNAAEVGGTPGGSAGSEASGPTQLRAVGPEVDVPSTANRCAASVPPASVSLGQQRLVCFDAGHVDCPRFVRAMGSPRGASGRASRPAPVVPIAVAAISTTDPTAGVPVVPGSESTAAGAVVPLPGEPAARPIVPVAPVVRSSRRSGARRAGSRSRPVVVASVILVGALVVAFAFTSLRGGIALPSAGPSAGAVVSPDGAASTVIASPTDGAPASSSASASTSPSPSPSPIPTASPSPSPTASPTPSASLPPAFAGLKPCPDLDRCYIYRIQSGDNLTAIAKRFGITIVALKAANPDIKDPSLLHVGDKIRVPLPES